MKTSKKLLAIVAMGIIMSGCAMGIDRARQAVTAGIHVLSATADEFDKIDAQKQADVIKKGQGGDLPGARADLKKWYAQRGKISHDYELAWDAIKTAARGVEAISSGTQKTVDFGQLASDVMAAIAQLVATLHDAGIKIPGVVQ